MSPDERIVFRRLRDVYLRHGKSPKYLAWLRNRHPGKELHHVFGSVHGRKSSDFGVVPVDPMVHRERQNDPDWCFSQIFQSIDLLLEYLDESNQ